MFNMKGILILIAFGVWVNLMIGVKENYATLKDAIYALSGNTLLVITVTYIILVIIGIFVETHDTDRFA